MAEGCAGLVRQARPLGDGLTSPNQIILAEDGGCLHATMGLAAWPDNSIGHIITDPPFNEHVHGGNRIGWHFDEGEGKKMPTKSMPMSFAAMTDEGRNNFCKQAVRTCKGWVLVFCALEDIGAWQQALVKAGAKRRNTCLWVKTVHAPKFAGDGPANCAEAIVTAWAGAGASKWNGGGKGGKYLLPTLRRNRVHECQKPASLLERLVMDFTSPGDLVADPYAGSGSTLVAAKKLGREYLGWEISKEHYATTLSELASTAEQRYLEGILSPDEVPVKAKQQKLDIG